MSNIENNLDFENLSEKEKELALQILKEIADNGNSKKYNDLLYSDYKEVPVDIETFIMSDEYIGKSWKDAQGNIKLYPYWIDVLKKLFPNNLDTCYNTFLESGARGLGKSEIACSVIFPYLIYRVLCLKDPLEFFHIKSTEKIAFAFMKLLPLISFKKQYKCHLGLCQKAPLHRGIIDHTGTHLNQLKL